MRLPNAHHAVVEIEKLSEYCLNPNHPRGKHRARLFAAALGISQHQAFQLRDFILACAQTAQATPVDQDAFGSRYSLDAPWPSTPIIIRSFWIVRTAEDFPRLVSCFVL